jgi:integrase
MQEGRAVGYRRLPGGKTGSWIAKHYAPGDGRRYHALGTADDYMDADGADALSFAQAQDRARAWFAELARNGGRVVEATTVRKAVEDYVADYVARGGKALAAMQATIDAHILPKLGDRKVADLTSSHIRAWHRDVANAPARLRTPHSSAKCKVRKVDANDADALRARRATANRVLTVLKAVLNHAFAEGRAASDDAWRRVKPYKAVDVPRIRYLSDQEAQRLVNACPTDLRALVSAALMTGCRYRELADLRPVDVNVDAGVLTIRSSKSGKPRHVMLPAEVAQFFIQAIEGSRDLLFVRLDGEAWGKSHQFRPLRAACQAAKITPAISFHVLRHTYASRLAMRGAPMAVIAEQLGHSDVKLTARHYAHLSPGYVAEAVRQVFGNLGLAPETDASPRRQGTID